MIDKYKNLVDNDAIKITTNDGSFTISFEGNLDLYWIYRPKARLFLEEDSHEFYITKENYFLYNLFERLYVSVKEGKPYLNCPYEIDNRYKEYRPFGSNELFIDNKIEWHSDDYPYDEASVVSISKYDEDSFKIEFKKSKGSYFPTFAVRVRNSGSRYQPFNSTFMSMYNSLINRDYDCHQIHYEEVLYEQKVLRKQFVNKYCEVRELMPMIEYSKWENF